VARYLAWQDWLRTCKLPIFVVWGRNDPIFTVAGAQAFRRDVPLAEIHLLDTGHFALEEEIDTIAARMKEFHAREVVNSCRMSPPSHAASRSRREAC